MAIARLSVKIGKAGKAAPHAAYISRTGKYKNRLAHGEKLEATGSGNMPGWAQHNPLLFWQAADNFERKNGSTYREHEIALPRELSPDQRLNLVNNWIQNELGENHAYQFAIHTPTASDGKEQPHCHLMFCERENDGIARDPEQFFKRYNSKNPERGGARKTNFSAKVSERKEQLKAQRQRWETLCNEHLKRAGATVKIDMRSYAEQGTDRTPEPKFLPSEWRNPETRNNLIQFRQAQQEQAEKNDALWELIPDTGAELEREKQEEYRRQNIPPSPDLIEEKWQEVYRICEPAVATERERRLDACETTSQAHSRHLRAEPQAPSGLFSGFKRKAYEQAHEVWAAEEKRLRGCWIDAMSERDSPLSVKRTTEKTFRQHYPELAAERERLKILEREKLDREREAKRKERELARKRRSRSRGRGRGGMER